MNINNEEECVILVLQEPTKINRHIESNLMIANLRWKKGANKYLEEQKKFNEILKKTLQFNSLE